MTRMEEKPIKVILTCGRCKNEKHLGFDAAEYSGLSNYLTVYPERLEYYRLYSHSAMPRAKGVIILCPGCYEIVDTFAKGLQEDKAEKMREFMRGEE